MNRTPIVLSLLGLALCIFGAYMMLRVLMPPLGGGMLDQSSEVAGVDIAALRQSAGSDVFSTYILLTASGFAIFAAGLAMLFGRLRG
ncbi:MAG TPA: hypothetical protein VHY09_13720 [Candidatus Methylacidiphilales bacterium]|jgi:hypothetical protein|nr:hypothetical protein [Candidatus Methylacidiphilales bacterium]